MHSRFLVVAAATVLAVTAAVPAGRSQAESRLLPVMTVNLYLGADVNPILGASSAPEALAAVATAWNQVQATDFGARADAIARQVAIADPWLIGVQEAVQYRTQTPADGPATAATTVAADHLQLLLDALDARGLHYEAAAISTGYDVELTGAFPNGLMDVRITQREVILAKSDLRPSQLRVTNPQTGQWSARLTVPTAFGVDVSLPWSWASIDANFAGRAVRFVTTHLDPIAPDVQLAQARELLAGPANTPLPTIIVGDFNSPADGSGSATYALLDDSGLQDAWAQVHPRLDGHTCCQDADLRSGRGQLSSRIDIVWYRGPIVAVFARTLGDRWLLDRTDDGLWPSDHAFVAATLAIR